jgi:hypothetical protein
MASVQYNVLYRYIHPTTKKAVTNTTKAAYDLNAKFIKAYPNSTGVDAQDVLVEQSADNTKYDMVFVFDGVEEINSIIAGTAGSLTAHILVEKFTRCKGECWFVSSTHASLAAALKAADPMVRALGKENVKVVKNVPLEITVGLE